MSTLEHIYSFLEDEGTNYPFYLLMAGISYCDDTYRIDRKNYPYYVFEYIIEGSGTLNINSYSYHPAKGDAYILQKGSSHLYFPDNGDPWIKIWITAKGNLIDQLVQAYNIYDTYYIKDCNLESLFNNIMEIAQSSNDNKKAIYDKVAILFHEMVIQIASKVNINIDIHSPTALKIKNYLDNHMDYNVSIKELSNYIFKSPSQTIRLFKKEFGITPYDYLLSRKIGTAKLLLQNTNLSIKEIAYKLNFTDEHHFSNSFKTKEGITPTLFRKRPII